MEADLGKIARRQKVWAALSSVLDALALPVAFVGQSVVELAVLPPARTNGRIFSLLRGMQLTRGILKLIRYRRQGKVKG